MGDHEEAVNTPPRHDRLFAVGASAGGVEALTKLVGALPESFPSAMLVVLHVGETSHLPEILDRAARLTVTEAESGQPVRGGTIYVAPPDRHMLIHDGHIVLRRGPRENLARPAVDPLFRSAACSYGARTTGVVLTGGLSDGAAGLRAIKRCGGVAVVQDPRDAVVPDMPTNALRHVDVDHCVTLAELPGLLVALTDRPVSETPPIPADIRLEAAIAYQEYAPSEEIGRFGALSPFTCPECQGPLWEIEDATILRYRCHVGHALTAEAMVSAQDGQVQLMLERLIRTHQQRAALAQRMAERDQALGREAGASALRKRSREYAEDAASIARLLEASSAEEAER